MYRIVLLDLDDTLLDFKKTEAAAVSQTLARFGIEPTPAVVQRYSEINQSLWKKLEKREITREKLLPHRFELLFAELAVNEDSNRVQAVYEKTLGTGHYFIDGAPELLQTLSKNHALYLVSNGTASVQRGRIASAGIEPYFRRMFISHEIGYNKPDIRFFEACFAEIDRFDKSETIIIGDSLSSDMEGGRRAGIATCWFNPHRHPLPDGVTVDHIVSNLADIPSIVG
ncbi:MAG: YjjG family noncanonical pyrimidine nucleotidase [Clostridia bacterium]|nr:YjjG family noncanonical pyrimidine nucleotidase [Clostridia bacterium]